MTRMAQIGFISLIGVIRVIFIHIYQHCQSFNATVNTNRSFTCNINYVIGEAILFIWLHTHHNPLSRLPYRPHNQLYLSRHIGTATQTTAHLLQLLPEVRIIVNPILQLTVSHLRIQIREITQASSVRPYVRISKFSIHSILFIYFHKSTKNGREERMFFQQ